MGLQVTVSLTSGEGEPTVFIPTDVDHTQSIGQYALDSIADAPIYDIKRFHVPGPDGNAIIRCGVFDGHFMLPVRYVDTQEQIKLTIAQQKNLWAQNAVDIEDEAGNTYENCNLIPGGFQQMQKVTAMGIFSDGEVVCFLKAMWVFRYDGGPIALG